MWTFRQNILGHTSCILTERGITLQEISILALFTAYMLYQSTFVMSTYLYFKFHFFQISDAKQNPVNTSELSHIATKKSRKTHLI